MISDCSSDNSWDTFTKAPSPVGGHLTFVVGQDGLLS